MGSSGVIERGVSTSSYVNIDRNLITQCASSRACENWRFLEPFIHSAKGIANLSWGGGTTCILTKTSSFHIFTIIISQCNTFILFIFFCSSFAFRLLHPPPFLASPSFGSARGRCPPCFLIYDPTNNYCLTVQYDFFFLHVCFSSSVMGLHRVINNPLLITTWEATQSYRFSLNFVALEWPCSESSNWGQ